MSQRRARITGAEWLARSLAANGTTHVFFIDAVLRRTLIELGTLGVTRVLAHAEKAAAYMADGYARVAGRPGICFAQSVGAANLAAGLQDAWLGRSPVIALTGHKPPAHQHRNAYQEVPHAPLYRAGHQVRRRGGRRRRPAAPAAPGLARGDDRLAAPGASRPQRAAGGDRRDRPGAANPPPPIRRCNCACRRTGRRRRMTRSSAPPPRCAPRERIAIVAGAGATASQAGPGAAGAGPGTGGADRHLARRARHHPDAPRAVDRLRRQLCRAAGQPDRARGRPGAVRRLPHRRSGDAHLAHPGARYAGGADRHRSAGAGPRRTATRSG